MQGESTLITTHVGADFDALGSMVAARRLYPGAMLFFPGSKEESVRRYLLSAQDLVLPEVRHRQVTPESISRLILCDIRQRSRIGVVAEWMYI